MPLIKAAGGLLCNVQKPGAILLKDPEEKTSICETTAHWYVSTKYIHDSVERNERLNIEDYRLNPESRAKRKDNGKVGSPSMSNGRTAYTPEEDDAILSYVSKHISEVGGNKIWQEMAKQQVTCHSWQSMKYRYKVQLAHKLPEYKQAEVEKETLMQVTEQCEAENENNKSASSQRSPVAAEEPNSSSEMDLTQISPSPNSQDEQAECNDNKEYDIMETSKSEIEETPEQEQPEQPVKDHQSEEISGAKAVINSVHRPITRQQFVLDNAPYVKRLRSSGAPSESPLKSPHKQTSKTKAYSSPKSDSHAQPPEKKVRKMEAKVVDTIEKDNEHSGPSEKTQTEKVNSPAPQPTETKKLGILEMATKEFEDDSESESDQYETPGPSTSVEAVIATSSNSDPATLLSENQGEGTGRIQDENPQPSPANANTADAVTVPAPPSSSHPAVSEPATGGALPTEQVTSKAHLFIFESESQEVEEDSQSLVAGPSTSAAGQTNEKTTTPSLTQDQLEEDVQVLKALMKETKQDLISVTKAILKASGDLILARELLLNLSSFSGLTWTRTEDQNLSSTDPSVREELLSKYGEEGVAKRLMFLELER